MMRVFQIISHLELGGAERVAVNIAKSQSSGIEYHVVEIVRGKSEFSCQLLNELTTSGIKVHRSPVTSKKLGILLFPLWFFFLNIRYRPQITHSHTEIPDLSVYLFHLFFPFKIKYIRTIHNTELWNNWKWIGNKVEHFFISHNSNIAISQSVRDCYEKSYHASNIPLIYNGVEEKSQKRFPGILGGKINILFSGRLEAQKGVDVLVKIVNLLAPDDRFFFHIVGDGPLKRELSKVIGNNYKLYDKLYDLASYMGSFDYIFMPSNFEGLALTAIEACFARTPTIINACNGLEEIFPADWPLKAQDNSIQDYMEIFLNKLFICDRVELATSAYEFVAEKFSIVSMQQKYDSLYYERTKA